MARTGTRHETRTGHRPGQVECHFCAPVLRLQPAEQGCMINSMVMEQMWVMRTGSVPGGGRTYGTRAGAKVSLGFNAGPCEPRTTLAKREHTSKKSTRNWAELVIFSGMKARL